MGGHTIVGIYHSLHSISHDVAMIVSYLTVLSIEGWFEPELVLPALLATPDNKDFDDLVSSVVLEILDEPDDDVTNLVVLVTFGTIKVNYNKNSIVLFNYLELSDLGLGVAIFIGSEDDVVNGVMISVKRIVVYCKPIIDIVVKAMGY